MTQDALFGTTTAATSDEWYTPGWIFDAAGIVFDLDVCAPMDPYERTCPALRYLTVEDDGLTQPWTGLVWCNPPYSRAAPWVDRWARHPDGLLLTPAVPEVRWRGRTDADAVAFISARFIRPGRSPARVPWALQLLSRGPTAGQALRRIAAADRYAAGTYYVRPPS